MSDASDLLGKITIRTAREAAFAVISITDNGGGIPDNIKDRIFEPFFTTKEVGKGTGQGLAIAYSVVVDKHGGRIDIETQQGESTTFHIRLPLGDLQNNTEAATKQPALQTG